MGPLWLFVHFFLHLLAASPPSLCTISSVVKKSCLTLNKDPIGMSIVIPGRHNVSKCGKRVFEKGRLSFRISAWEVCQSDTQILHRARERYGPTKVEKGWQPLGRSAGSCLKMAADGMALFLKTLRAPPNLNLVPIIIPATVSVAEKFSLKATKFVSSGTAAQGLWGRVLNMVPSSPPSTYVSPAR